MPVNVPFRLSTAIRIILQPESTTVEPDAAATFTISATGYTSLIWQSYDENQNAWDDMTGQTDPTLSIVGTLAINGARYRVKLSSATQTVYSDAATLTVAVSSSPPVITQNPQDATANSGETASFSVLATGTAPLTYQWQVDTGGGYGDISGATDSTYTTGTLSGTDNGNLYRCGVTNTAGGPVYSDPATLTVVSVSVPSAPTSLAASNVAETSLDLTWTDNASNEDDYVIDQRLDGGTTWQRIATIPANSTSYSVTGLTGETAYEFRVGARNIAGTTFSSTLDQTTAAAGGEVPVFAIDPKTQTINDGNYAVLGVKAQGPGVSLQWQSNTGGGWSNVTGETDPVLVTGALTTADTGIQYRCVATNSNGSTNSATATITVSAYTPVYPLDNTAGVRCGGSLYKLRSAQTNCCRVRRTTDNTEQDIGFVGQLPDMAAMKTFAAGGSLRVVHFDSVSAEPDIAAPTDAEEPYVMVDGEFCLGANGLLTCRFISNSDADLREVANHYMEVTVGSAIANNDFQAFVCSQTTIKENSSTYLFNLEGVAKSFANQVTGAGQSRYTVTNHADVTDVQDVPQWYGCRIYWADSSNVYERWNKSTKVSQAGSHSAATSTSVRIGDASGSSKNFDGDFDTLFVYSGLNASGIETVYQDLIQVIPKLGPAADAASVVPTSTWWQKELYDWWAAKSSADFNVGSASLTWDGTYASTDDLWQLYAATATFPAALDNGHDIWSASGDYCLDDGGAATVTPSATQDCWVDEANPTAINDSPAYYVIQAASATDRKEGFLEFDLTGVSSGITEAVISLYVDWLSGSTDKTQIGIKLHFDTAFTASATSWNSPPVTVSVDPAWETRERIRSTEYATTVDFHIIFNDEAQEIQGELAPIINAAISGGATKMLVQIFNAHFQLYGTYTDTVLRVDGINGTNPPALSLIYKRGVEVYTDVCIPNGNLNLNHAQRNGNTGAAMTALNLPLSGGGQGNPFYGDSGLANRALALSIFYMLQGEAAIADNDAVSDTMQWFGKRIRTAALTYYYANSHLTAGARIAYETGLQEMIRYLWVMPPRDINTNMDCATGEAAGCATAGARDNFLLNWHAVRTMRNVPFGRPDGTVSNIHPLRRTWWSSGYIGENDGPDPSYNGRSIYYLVSGLAWGHWDDEIVQAYTPLIRNLQKFASYQYLPNGAGGYESCHGFACRTTAGADDSQMEDRTMRGLMGGYFVGGDALPEAIEKLPANAAAGVSAIQSAISSVNSDVAESSVGFLTNGSGYAQPVFTGHPWVYRHGAMWSEDTPPVPPPGWFTVLDALRSDANATFPPDRAATYSETFGDPSLDFEEFWAVKDNDGTTDFGFFVAAVQQNVSYNGSYGGMLEGFWTDDAGTVINCAHGKTGGADSGDPGYEDSVRTSALANLPVHAISGVWRDQFETYSAGTATVDGDKTSFYHAGKWYRVSGADVNQYGTLNEIGRFQVGTSSYDGGTGKTTITFPSPSSAFTTGCWINHRYCTAWANENIKPVDGTSVVDGSKTYSDWYLDDGGDPRIESYVNLGHSGKEGASNKVNGIVPSGNVVLKKTFRKLSDGISITHTITADATAQTIYRSDCRVTLPVLLTNSGADTVIQYWDAANSGWAFLTTDKVSTQYIRLTRNISGADKYVYIYLDTTYEVSYSAQYDAPYQITGKSFRNIEIHLQTTPGTPELWPATESVVASVRTTNPGLGSGTVTSSLLLLPEDGVTVGTASVFAAKWTTSWGSSGAGTCTVEFYNGSTWSDSGATVSQNVDNDFEAIVYPIPSSTTKWRVKAVDGGANTLYSSERTITVSLMTLVTQDTFTDTNGVLVSAHTPDSGTWLNNDKSTPAELEINSNNARQIVGAGATNLLADSGAAAVGRQHVTCDITIPTGVTGEKIRYHPMAQILSRYTSNPALGIVLGVDNVTGGRGFIINSLGQVDPYEGYANTFHLTDVGGDASNFPYLDKVLRLELWTVGATTVAGRVYNVTDATEVCKLALFGHAHTSTNRRGIGLRWANEDTLLVCHSVSCYTW